MEKELVRKLGEQIGYGNMMYLASECWKESMIKQGYPTTGVFIPALPCDVREEETYNDVPAGGLGKHDVNQQRELLLAFCDHLNTYAGMEEVRFDFMMQDFLDKSQ
jgi:hypothetical protein